MRLTLRTLLAYLDDTLEPHEIKEMGQKVAESDAAQELVARIKQVTRRRRLTTPPPGGPNAKFDANTMAEYLDNELSSELVAELEKTCLESDVHLAEVASCHQILTLVLGEPALVPPTARERMYGLVKGREAIPFRKARSREGVVEGDGGDRDADDPLLPGLPSSRGWLLWALPLAAVLVFAALAVAVWRDLPPTPAPAVAKVNPAPPTDTPADPNKGAPVPPAPAPPTPPADTPMNPPTPPMNPPMNPPPPPVAPAPPDERPKPPSKVRASIGAYLAPPRGEPSILVQRQTDQPGWKRLTAGKSDVFSTDDLVSLPGYNSELALGPDGAVRVLLHGNVPPFTVHPVRDLLMKGPLGPPERLFFLQRVEAAMDFLMESAVRLNQPEAGFDADLTLDRGRIYLSTHKPNGPVKVRLRFAGEVWDVTLLDPDSEVGVELFQAYFGDINYLDEAPFRGVNLFVFSGRADIKFDSRTYGDLPSRTSVLWDNKGPGATAPWLIPLQDWPLVQAVWSKTPPAGANQADREAVLNMRSALDSLSISMVEKKAVDGTLLEARGPNSEPMQRLLAVYSLGAIDAVDRVLDVLCTDESEAHAPDRNAAVFTLRRWIGRDMANGLQLYDEKKEKGMLIDGRHLLIVDAKNIFVLLHDFPGKDLRQTATFDRLTSLLRDKALPVRELAYWHLLKLSAGARVPLPDYNAAWGEGQREAAVAQWKALIGKELPPPAPMPMPMPPGQ